MQPQQINEIIKKVCKKVKRGLVQSVHNLNMFRTKGYYLLRPIRQIKKPPDKLETTPILLRMRMRQ